MVSAIFPKISLGAPSALAGLNRLRQHQYARQNLAGGHDGNAILPPGRETKNH
jgi:hypothetical protein